MNLKRKPEEIFPTEILEAMPRMGDSSKLHREEIKIPLKVFNASGSQTWFLYEYDPEDRIFFGFANLGDSMYAECGIIPMDELLEYNDTTPFLRFNLDRDEHWNAERTLKEVMDMVNSGVCV
jgi:hypothetical protein